MYLNSIKLVQLVLIENHNAKTNQINPLISKYWEFQFFMIFAKELTEL